VSASGLLVAGLEGCIRYKPTGSHQFTQNEMILAGHGCCCPVWLLNRLTHGSWWDVLVAHSPPLGIHNGLDPRAHWLLRVPWP